MINLDYVNSKIIDKTHYFAMQVFLEYTDAGGIVYHANYLRYLERARSDFIRLMKIENMLDNNFFVVRHINIDYLRTAYQTNNLIVKTIISHVGKASIIMSQSIERNSEIIVKADIRIAIINSQAKPQRFNDLIYRAFALYL